MEHRRPAEGAGLARTLRCREIQRAQDVIAYLFARLERPPTDDELYRHLRPILCGRESELAPFAEVFQGSASGAPSAETTVGYRRRLRRHWLVGLAAAAVLAVLVGVAILLSSEAIPATPPQAAVRACRGRPGSGSVQ